MAINDELKNTTTQIQDSGVDKIKQETPQTETNYYDLLKQENYKALLDKEIQLDNARQRAYKQTNVALASQGMQTSGYGATANTGIESQYISALENASTDYQTSQNNIRQQEIASETTSSNDAFQSLTTLMGQSTSASDLDNLMKQYGYIDTNGQWDESKLSTLNENDRNQLKFIYSLYNNQLAKNDYLSNSTVNGNALKDAGTAISAITTSAGTTGSDISDEIKLLYSDSSIVGKTKDGYAVKLTNGHNDGIYAYLVYYNGAWYQTTANIYNAAKSKDEIKGGQLQS